MNIKQLEDLAKKNPALARAINLWIISAISTLISMLISFLSNWDVIDFKAIFIALLIPIGWYLDKLNRDLNRNSKI